MVAVTAARVAAHWPCCEQSRRPPDHGLATWSGRPGVDEEQAEAMTDGSPPLRLAGSFDVFYQEEYRGLVQLAFVLSGSRSGAEDIAQDALVAAWKKWRELEQPLAWT